MTMLRSLPARNAAPRPRPALANATLVSRVEVTGTLGVFAVVLDAPLGAYKPGQYVSLGMENAGELVQRPYSIVSLDRTGTRVELFIRRLPDGRLSNILWALSLGARVRVGPARGLFVLDRDDARPRLLIGTGTGLAPLLAMLDDACARADTTPNVLIHGVSWFAELAYASRIRDWQAGSVPIDYRPTVSRPDERRNSGWDGPVGRAEAQVERLLLDHPALVDAPAYLCGNPDMIDACRRALLAAGVAPTDIHAEQFHAPVGQTPQPSPRMA
ncbi:MAG: FAD-binding oxidoreductase [Chloroflexota bacterium]|nr:FAD-binding oxidoreductase [Chloroflexota bacterium]